MVDVSTDPGPMLLESAKKGNVGLMARIFEECKKLDVSPKDGLGNTPLHYSVQGGHIDTLRMLLDHSADCNVQNFAGDTPLHKAAAGDNMTIIELVLEGGGDPRIANKKKLSPIHSAKSPSVRALLQRVANIKKDEEENEDNDMIDSGSD